MKAPPIKDARICYQCDKDLYPKGKFITDDQYAIQDSKGNWRCMDCMKEDADNELIRRLPELRDGLSLNIYHCLQNKV
jgi:hypothetical protein